MSRYKNVITLLEMADDYNQDKLVDLLLDEDTSTDDLAEDIAFVIISLWGLIDERVKVRFRERLTIEIVNVEIASMFDIPDEGDVKWKDS